LGRRLRLGADATLLGRWKLAGRDLWPVMEGTSRDGAAVVWSYLAVVGDDRAEIFPDDELDAAVSRFEELTGG
jgi:hypothetical protein